MPNFLVPRKSTLHRAAATALYRALLYQSRVAPLLSEQKDQIQNIVRNRFKQSKHVHSIRRLRVSFEAGYEAIDHLDAAVNGSHEAKEYVTSLLERAPAKVKEPPPFKPWRSLRKVKDTSHESEDGSENKPTIPLFDRPLPLEKLSGKRHVPILFNPNNIPVLRLKKPQPESLSRYIGQRLRQRQARHDRRYRLYEELKLAVQEDEWDEITAEDGEPERGQTIADALSGARISRESTWSDAVQDAITEVHGQLNEERWKNQAMAEKMQSVIDRERGLYDKERAEKKEVKRMERIERREERRLGKQGDDDVNEDTGVDQSERLAMAK